jgi:arylsulfatase/arylsulfatase A
MRQSNFTPRIWARSLFLWTGLVPAIISCGAAMDALARARPNIVLIMTDDQGYGDLGVHGNPVIETPNLDAMAARSARLESFYVCPVCTPTRACLMTGRWQYRTRAFDTYVGRAMMDPEEVTVAEVLAGAGYATGIFGKWHLGDNYPLRPQDQGFRETLVLRGGGIGQPSDPPGGEGKYTDPILFHNGREKQFDGFCTDLYFEHAIGWLRLQHAAGRPFFAYIATNAPHGPFDDVPADLYAKYKTKDLSPVLLGKDNQADVVAQVFAMVENIDQNVGKLFAALEELGLVQNTIVIFMCDNGPNTRRYVGKLRGMKGEVLEGGIRSPFFVHWPARLEPGVHSSEPAAHIDVMPTLLAAAGVEPPAGLKLDGRNILPLLEGGATDWPQRSLVLQWHRGDEPQPLRHFALRRGEWKLLNQKGRAEPWRESNENEVVQVEQFDLELYNLAKDPGEQHNLIADELTLAKELINEYEAWFRDVSTTREDNFAPPRMIIGSEEQPVVVLTRQDWRRTGGDGWGEQGEWHLEVEREGRFEMTVRLAKPLDAESGRITVRAGGVQQTGEIAQGEREVTLEQVELPQGPVDVSVEIRVGGETTGPHQVVIAVKASPPPPGPLPHPVGGGEDGGALSPDP